MIDKKRLGVTQIVPLLANQRIWNGTPKLLFQLSRKRKRLGKKEVLLANFIIACYNESEVSCERVIQVQYEIL